MMERFRMIQCMVRCTNIETTKERLDCETTCFKEKGVYYYSIEHLKPTKTYLTGARYKRSLRHCIRMGGKKGKCKIDARHTDYY
jgi:hypothetical protein